MARSRAGQQWVVQAQADRGSGRVMLVRASVLARLLGIKLLRLEADVAVIPDVAPAGAVPSPVESPDRPGSATIVEQAPSTAAPLPPAMPAHPVPPLPAGPAGGSGDLAEAQELLNGANRTLRAAKSRLPG